MSQKSDSLEYRNMVRSRYNRLHDAFINSEETKKAHDCLKNYYKIPEPYATNIIERIWSNAYEIISKPR